MAITRRKAIASLPTGMAAVSGFSEFAAAQGTQNGPAPPVDIVALIDTVFKAYTSHDFTSLKTVYGDNLTIIDGFAPYHWIGPNALDKWWADAEKWNKDMGVESEDLSSEGIRAWVVSGDRAYASISATLRIKLKQGQSLTRPGILVLTFGKLGEMWKADGQAWARVS
jgi:ketosteroid isomerase-like protein